MGLTPEGQVCVSGNVLGITLMVVSEYAQQYIACQ